MHILIFFSFLFLAVSATEIETISRKIDLTSHISAITIDFKGISGLENEFVVLIDDVHKDKVAFFDAQAKDENLEIVLKKQYSKGFDAFIIKINSKIDSLKLSYYLFKTQIPKPAEVLQQEKQYAKFHGNSFVLLPYAVKSQTTTVKLPSGQLLMYSAPEKPVSKNEPNLTYGPYLMKAPFSQSIFAVHYQIMDKFLTITKMTRSIEISHWGNIAVEEDIEIHNTGAALKGPFSRFEYMQGTGQDKAVASWDTLLPSSARDIYYRDLIGNVSTSQVSKLYSAVQLQIKPRFPIMGGWKTRYTIGYNMPAHEYLFKDGSKFLLKMRIIDHIHSAQFVEDFTLKIILPEAIKDIKIVLPYTMERKPDSKMPTYLDISGREVLTLQAHNLIDKHIQDFTITYEFSMPLMFREFAMAIGGFMTLFLAIIVYVRMDFSISKNAQKDLAMRTEALVSEVIALHEKRRSCYTRYENSLNNCKTNKDLSKLNYDCKSLDNERESISKSIGLLREKMRAIWSEGSERLQELQDLDKKYREHLTSVIHVVSNFVSGRLSIAELKTQESELNAKLIGVVDKMNSLVNNL